MDPSSATPRPNLYDPSGAPVERVEVPIDLARAALPATVVLQGRPFLVTEPRRGEYALLSTVCPHAGGHVVDKGSHFECPNHLWRFDRMSGECINTPGQRLSRVPIEIEDGRMFAAVPPAPPARPRRALRGVSIAVHAHAPLELSFGGFSLLTDPWLDGLVSGSDLAPDAIWISHDHSDHFHLPTLERFDRATPIYMPDFPNRQIELRCRAAGFTDVNPMPFGRRFELTPDFHITCFEPASLWNDAIVLVEMGSLSS
jgi:CMP-N-acetylneuraminate monooxygenase